MHVGFLKTLLVAQIWGDFPRWQDREAPQSFGMTIFGWHHLLSNWGERKGLELLVWSKSPLRICLAFQAGRHPYWYRKSRCEEATPVPRHSCFSWQKAQLARSFSELASDIFPLPVCVSANYNSVWKMWTRIPLISPKLRARLCNAQNFAGRGFMHSRKDKCLGEAELTTTTAFAWKGRLAVVKDTEWCACLWF